MKNYSGINIKYLELLGKGTQGKVYKIDNEKCIKIFKNKKECQEELNTLIIAQKDNHFPKLYEYDEDYIIREYINGVELDEYLSTQGPTPQIFDKIIKLYEAMHKVGYTRLDAAIFHIFVTPEDELKLIDTAKALRKKTLIPSLLISGIERLSLKDDLFSYLRNYRPDLYNIWKNYTKKDYTKMN